MEAHHQELHLDKTELLFVEKASPILDLSINTDRSVGPVIVTAVNLGGTLDDSLFFTANSAATTTSGGVPHTLSQVLLKALVILHLDHCYTLLASQQVCANCPLQLLQRSAAQPIFNLPKFNLCSTRLPSGQLQAYKPHLHPTQTKNSSGQTASCYHHVALKHNRAVCLHDEIHVHDDHRILVPFGVVSLRLNAHIARRFGQMLNKNKYKLDSMGCGRLVWMVFIL